MLTFINEKKTHYLFNGKSIKNLLKPNIHSWTSQTKRERKKTFARYFHWKKSSRSIQIFTRINFVILPIFNDFFFMHLFMSEKQTLIAKITSNNFHIVKGQFLHIFLFVIYNDQKKTETKNKRKINSRLSIGILKLVLFAYSIRFDWMIYLWFCECKKKFQIKFEIHSFLWKNDQHETAEWKK